MIITPATFPTDVSSLTQWHKALPKVLSVMVYASTKTDAYGVHGAVNDN